MTIYYIKVRGVIVTLAIYSPPQRQVAYKAYEATSFTRPVALWFVWPYVCDKNEGLESNYILR